VQESSDAFLQLRSADVLDYVSVVNTA